MDGHGEEVMKRGMAIWKNAVTTRCGAPGAVLPLDAIPQTMTRRNEKQPAFLFVFVRDQLEKYKIYK